MASPCGETLPASRWTAPGRLRLQPKPKKSAADGVSFSVGCPPADPEPRERCMQGLLPTNGGGGGGVDPEPPADPKVPHRGPDRRQRKTPRFSRYSLWGGR